MKTIQGPAIFLAQFLGDEPPFDSLEHLAQWAAGLGYKGLQLPTAPRLFDLEQAAASQQQLLPLVTRLYRLDNGASLQRQWQEGGCRLF